MKNTFSAMLLAAALASAPAWAHEGHAHKVMGTVSAIHENHLEIKATDGKTATMTITEKTKVVRGKTAMKPADIRPGDRVVVTATETKGKDGKTSVVANQIQLGTAATPSAKK